MSMDDIYTIVRSANFVWAGILFLLMIFWGGQDIIISRSCPHTHIPPEMRFLQAAGFGMVVSVCISLSEIFLKHAPGGLRVFTAFLFLVPLSFAMHQAIFRIKMHRKAVANGDCDYNWEHE